LEDLGLDGKKILKQMLKRERECEGVD